MELEQVIAITIFAVIVVYAAVKHIQRRKFRKENPAVPGLPDTVEPTEPGEN